MLKNKINIYLIQYAIDAILRNRAKNLFIVVIFTLLVFLLTSVFFIANSIKYELNLTVDALPQIIVQKTKAGKVYDIKSSMADKILEIAGVKSANARVWGYYHFTNADVNFTVVGIDQYEIQYKDNFDKMITKFDLDDTSFGSSMIVGQGVKKVLNHNHYSDYFNFIKSNGELERVYLAGVFDTDIDLEANDTIVMSKDLLREIFDISESMATDIVVSVSNPLEIDTVALKIAQLYPDTTIITNNDLKVSYQHIFDYKSGLFLALFIISIFTFFMIVYDKSSGLSSEEKKEIGILKAVGWKSDDVLKEKFYEGFIISFVSYILGVILAFGFVYTLQAPLLRDIFVGYDGIKPTFLLPFVYDIQTLLLVFLLSVPIYISATIIPSWRVATIDSDEVMR
jgi:ABC-type lipoprotein release transport system permease subunit